jgi:transcriptional regulator with XRE-family HTH domain
MKSIGQKIREIKGYSQEYVANRLNMSQNSYSKIELEQTRLNIERLNEIAGVFEISPNEILNFDDSYLFKSISHNQTGGETKSGIFNNDLLAQSQSDEILYLRTENIKLMALVEKLLNK